VSILSILCKETEPPRLKANKEGWRGINDDDDENHYPFPLVMKPRNRSDSLASAISGTATPSGGRKLSEKDLAQADAALSNINGANGH
jgi:glycogen(starch) synthase